MMHSYLRLAQLSLIIAAITWLASFSNAFTCRRFIPAGATSRRRSISTTGSTGSSYSLTAVPKVQQVSEMPPPLPSSENLKNKYYLLRHGQSTANVAEIISSARSLAYTDTHGLTDTGYQQGKDSAKQLLDLLDSEEERKDNKSRRLVFVSSPFARAKQTAQACVDGLKEAHLERLEKNKNKLSDLQLDEEIAMEDRLVERYFGRLDAQAIYTYAYVWPLDQFNVTHTAFDVESVAAVCHRIFAIVQDCEQQYKDCHLVLVSHADVLQIAQLYAAGADNVGLFSAYRFKNGEVRPMIVGSTNHLPDPLPLEAPDRGTSLFTKAAYDISTRER